MENSEQIIKNLQKLSQYLMKRVEEQDKVIFNLKRELAERDDYSGLKDGNTKQQQLCIGMRFGNV